MKRISIEADTSQIQEGQVSSEKSRQVLIDKWLLAHGAHDPLELDLGTLMSIGESVRDGMAPGALCGAVGS